MRTIILIVTLFVSLPAISQKKLPNVIEKLTYRGYYNWSFIWINAGSVEMTVQPSDKYPNAQCIFAVGYSNPSWDWVFKLRDTLISHHDSMTYKP